MKVTEQGSPQWPCDLAGLVEYQPEAIVSRAVVQAAGGSVTLFAFDKGQRLNEHTAPFDALVQVLEGAATIIIEGKAFRTAAGQAILMPAGRPHAVEADERCKMVLTMIHA
ncbi:MAG: cupin domain-containing protein [candidate division KSB1 bacterium]|nr:cupin domain-containing protein [candidate division KSB1 bacterium]